MKFSLLAGFLLRAVFWLLLCLVLWYLSGPFLAPIVAWFAGSLAHFLFPSWTEGWQLVGATHVDLATNLEMPLPPGAPSGRVPLLSPEADYLAYGYGLPLLMALFLASRPHGLAWKMGLGALALLPAQAVSVFFDWLKQVAILAGPEVAARTGFGEPARELVALGYQFGTLILPTLAPVVIWLALDRRLVSTLLVEAYLARAEPDDPNPAGPR